MTISRSSSSMNRFQRSCKCRKKGVLDVKNFIADVCLTLWPEYFEVSCTIYTWRLFFEKIAGSDDRVQLKVRDRHIDHSSKAWHTEIPDIVPGIARC